MRVLPPPKAPPLRRGALAVGAMPFGHQLRQHGRSLGGRSPVLCAAFGQASAMPKKLHQDEPFQATAWWKTSLKTFKRGIVPSFQSLRFHCRTASSNPSRSATNCIIDIPYSPPAERRVRSQPSLRGRSCPHRPQSPARIICAMPRASLRSPSDRLTAAREGMGIALGPCLMAEADAGLVRLLPEIELVGPEVWLLVHRELADLARVRATRAPTRVLE